MACQIDALIARIDREIATQLDCVLHHPDFQKLEAIWRGVRMLVDAVPPDQEFSVDREFAGEDSGDGVLLSLLDIRPVELAEDVRQGASLRDTLIFRWFYRNALNVYGGIPFSLVLADFEFTQHPQDIFVLRRLARVASQAFSVFVTAVQPTFFGMDSFAELNSTVEFDERPRVWRDHLPISEEWESLRAELDSRFLGVCLPRVMMRRPYDYRRGLGKGGQLSPDDDRDDKTTIRYRESIDADGRGVLWGNAVYAFGAVVLECYARTGWLADIHGVAADGFSGGILRRPESMMDRFDRDPHSVLFKPATDAMFHDRLDKELAELGFMALTHRHGTEHAAFCATPSVYSPPDPANVDHVLSSMLQYTLCVCRFAHAIKRLGHQMVGDQRTASEIGGTIRNFLAEYRLTNVQASAKQKAERPLRDFRVDVTPAPGRPGEFDCQIMLQMHHELEAAQVEFKTQLIGMEQSAAS